MRIPQHSRLLLSLAAAGTGAESDVNAIWLDTCVGREGKLAFTDDTRPATLD